MSLLEGELAIEGKALEISHSLIENAIMESTLAEASWQQYVFSPRQAGLVFVLFWRNQELVISHPICA